MSVINALADWQPLCQALQRVGPRVFCRWGGEEFLVAVLPIARSLKMLLTWLNPLRQKSRTKHEFLLYLDQKNFRMTLEVFCVAHQ